MSTLRRLILVRHGETEGESSTRYHGSADVELSPHGVAEMMGVRRALAREPFDLVVASPLRRAWKAAWIIGDARPVRLESGLREIHFGRWEGLTAAEIEASDPVLFHDWRSGAASFEYPSGEPRAAFRGRVECALTGLLAAHANAAVVVAHKGVIRTIVEVLTGEKLEREEPPLAGIIELTRTPDGKWFHGRRSSNPPGLEEAA